MADLTNKTIAETYKDLLTVNSGTDNQGLESSLKTISDGEGVESALQLSTTKVYIPSGATLQVDGTLLLASEADLSIGDDLVVGDLTTTEQLKVGGGFVAGSGTGITMTSAGAVSMNSTLTVESNAIIDSLTVGDGYGDTGLTIAADGDLETNGSLTVDGHLKCAGNFTTAKIKQENKKTGVDVDSDDKVVITVEKDSVDKELLSIAKDGNLIIKDEDADQKFEIKDTGPVKFKSKSTSEIDAITGTDGEMVYDEDRQAFKIWVEPPP